MQVRPTFVSQSAFTRRQNHPTPHLAPAVKFGNSNDDGPSMTPEAMKWLLGGVLTIASIGGFFGYQADQKSQQRVQATMSEAAQGWQEAKTVNDKMKFIRENIGQKITDVDSNYEDKLAEWAAKKISEIPTDRNKVLLILDGLVTNPSIITEHQQTLLASIEDLSIKEKVKQLISLQPRSTYVRFRFEFNRNKSDTGRTDKRAEDDAFYRHAQEQGAKLDAERAAQKAEYDRLREELKAFALEKPAT